MVENTFAVKLYGLNQISSPSHLDERGVHICLFKVTPPKIEIFVQKRRCPNPPECKDLWEFPGGSVEFPGNLLLNACREFFEEAGINDNTVSLLYFNSIRIPLPAPRGSTHLFFLTTYRWKELLANCKPTEEAYAHQFIPIHQLNELEFTPTQTGYFLPIIKAVLEPYNQ